MMKPDPQAPVMPDGFNAREGMINVTRPYLPDIDRFKSYIDRIYESAFLTNSAALHNELKQRLQAYLDVSNLLPVSNGTAALQLAYRLAGLHGEVITTPFSFVATTSSIVWEGLTPVFVDIDPASFNINADLIEDSITDKTSAIVATHVFGNPCEINKLQKIADKHSLKLIFDAAHAFGVQYQGNSVLNYGDVSIMSFHATKMFHTAEGGALVVNNDDLYETARRMTNFGFIKEDTIVELGINAKMNELEAAMGLCVLDDINDILLSQRHIYQRYIDELTACAEFQIINEHAAINYSYFPVVFSSEEQALKVKSNLLEKNIRARRYFYPSLNKLSYLENMSACPVSESISSRILCLPLYYGLEAQDQKTIISVIKSS